MYHFITSYITMSITISITSPSFSLSLCLSTVHTDRFTVRVARKYGGSERSRRRLGGGSHGRVQHPWQGDLTVENENENENGMSGVTFAMQ